ncbi:hypothetical protein F4604DRAFT_1013640 [Suillus subluteus]|nr:hypothetical protein F4604DRAFT_1013640 [Suillus subluteus]
MRATRNECAHRLAKTALSGVAASQIGGKTLHSWATIPARKGLPRSDNWIFRMTRETAKRRNANMDGKWLLAADEMRQGIPQQVLDSPLAGLSVILLGDFHQFPPIGSRNRALYSQHPHSSKAQLGRNLYLQFDTVVELRQHMRVTDIVWDGILRRARNGACTNEDLVKIRRLVLTNKECDIPDFSTAPWNDAVLITPRNSVRSRWNACATEKHSLLSGEMLYICPAEDSAREAPLSPSQRLLVARLLLKETEDLPTMIRIVKGM